MINIRKSDGSVRAQIEAQLMTDPQQEEHSMRRTSDEQEMAFRCLELAVTDPKRGYGSCTELADTFLAFVTGKENGDARKTLDAIREALGR